MVAARRTERLVDERVLRSEKHDAQECGQAQRYHEALSQRVQDAEGLTPKRDVEGEDDGSVRVRGVEGWWRCALVGPAEDAWIRVSSARRGVY